MTSPGTKLTIRLLEKHNKPYLINPSSTQIREFVKGKKVINIAGNREKSLSKDLIEAYRNILMQGLITQTSPIDSAREDLHAKVAELGDKFTARQKTLWTNKINDATTEKELGAIMKKLCKF